VKSQFHVPMILLTFFLLSLTLNNLSDTSSHPQVYKQHIIILEGDSGSVTMEKADKKLPMVPGLSTDQTETLILIPLFLFNFSVFILKLRRHLFIGPIFYQSNYLIHFFYLLKNKY
jgi:hypothetical protein